MLTVAIIVSGVASGTRDLPTVQALRLGAVNADALIGGSGGAVGSVELGRTSTILKPVAVPTAAPISHEPVAYIAGAGDSVASLATRFGITEEAIRWSNLDALKDLDHDLSSGQQVVIPPVPGLVVTAAEGDSATSLATRYHADPQAITDFNYLRDPDHLEAGRTLVIPGGTGPELVRTPQPAPVYRPQTVAPAAARPASTVTSTSTSTSGGVAAGSAGGNRFSYGYCTWYVASRRPVPWLGDAGQWYGQAQAFGWSTGSAPRPGAIMVTRESGWGHVAIVESVNPDGSWLVSEMNFRGWAVISQRVIRPGGVPLIGFIY